MGEGAAVLPYGRQTIEEDDIEAVARVLRSDYLTTGPEVDAFEAELAQACGVQHAIVVSNGTAALHAAYAALGIGPGCEVITTPLTFSATANTVVALGGRPRFVDVDRETLCIDPAKVEAAITPRTKVIAAVDFAGHPADYEALRTIADRKKVALLADASHSIGGSLRGRPVGALADVTTFSFHPVKNLTTGEGGAVLTDDPALARRARDFRNHGLVRDAARLPPQQPAWYYDIQSLGLNYRLTDLQCALGRSQLKKLPRFVARRSELVAAYRRALAGVADLTLPFQAPHADPAWHLFAPRIGTGALRDRLYNELRQHDILPQVHYVAVNAFSFYRDMGFDASETPVALDASQRLLSLPLFPAMTQDDVERVAREVASALRAR
jgi:perosamine synthetase